MRSKLWSRTCGPQILAKDHGAFLCIRANGAARGRGRLRVARVVTVSRRPSKVSPKVASLNRSRCNVAKGLATHSRVLLRESSSEPPPRSVAHWHRVRRVCESGGTASELFTARQVAARSSSGGSDRQASKVGRSFSSSQSDRTCYRTASNCQRCSRRERARSRQARASLPTGEQTLTLPSRLDSRTRMGKSTAVKRDIWFRSAKEEGASLSSEVKHFEITTHRGLFKTRQATAPDRRTSSSSSPNSSSYGMASSGVSTCARLQVRRASRCPPIASKQADPLKLARYRLMVPSLVTKAQVSLRRAVSSRSMLTKPSSLQSG